MFIFFVFPVHATLSMNSTLKPQTLTEHRIRCSKFSLNHCHLFAHSNIKIPTIETMELMKFKIYDQYDTQLRNHKDFDSTYPSPIIFLCRRDRYADYGFGEFLLLMVWMLYHPVLKKRRLAINILNYYLFLSYIYTQVIMLTYSFICIFFQFHFCVLYIIS